MKYVTLVGSRLIENEDISRAYEVTKLLNHIGYKGRSGGASGMDTTWENFMLKMEVILPYNNFNSHKQDLEKYFALEYAPDDLKLKAEGIAILHHPYGDSLRGFALQAHTRNVFQVLGLGLDKPSDITIYAAPESKARKVSGGTATAVEVSRSHNVPTFNIRIDADYTELIKLLNSQL